MGTAVDAFCQMSVQRSPLLPIKGWQSLLRRHFQFGFFLRQRRDRLVADRIARVGKLGYPLHHYLRVAQFAQAAEKRLGQPLHLLPCRIRIDG